METFTGLSRMKRLNCSYNQQISRLPLLLFSEMRGLKNLDLRHLAINNIAIEHFLHNTNLTRLYLAKFRYCLFAPKARLCFPVSDGVSSLKKLLVYPILQVAVWLVAFITCMGNFTVLLWRSVSGKEDAVLSLCVKNLSLADFLMGVYLAIIASHDLAFEDRFLERALGWMSSWQCSASGFLAMLSSEISVFIVTLVAIERYRNITGSSRTVTLKVARITLAAAWFFAALIAGFPLLMWPARPIGYYGSNGLCFPLHINEPFSEGWQYSAVIFLGLNFSAVILILVLYGSLFSMLSRDRKFARPGCVDKRREDLVLAVRFFFIVLTDCLCWLPIVIIKLLAFADAEISRK